MRNEKDTFNIQDWATKRIIEIKEEINEHIAGGMKALEAIDIVLEESTLPYAIKEQIRQDVVRQGRGFIRSCGLAFGVIG